MVKHWSRSHRVWKKKKRRKISQLTLLTLQLFIDLSLWTADKKRSMKRVNRCIHSWKRERQPPSLSFCYLHKMLNRLVNRHFHKCVNWQILSHFIQIIIIMRAIEKQLAHNTRSIAQRHVNIIISQHLFLILPKITHFSNGAVLKAFFTHAKRFSWFFDFDSIVCFNHEFRFISQTWSKVNKSY